MITPIFKSGVKSQEKLKIIGLVCENICSSQFRFLPRHSSLQQLLVKLNLIVSALENKNSVDCIYLDFLKAFDSVPHNELLLKLWNLGVNGDLWKWFKA